MAPRPRLAETFCGCWSLLRGVQMVASYTVVISGFSMIALFGAGRIPGQSTAVAVMQCIQRLMHMMGLFAGLKGLTGVALREPSRLRMLLIYYVMELIVNIVDMVVREAMACVDLASFQRLHPHNSTDHSSQIDKVECSSVRWVVFMDYTVYALFYAYVAYAIWSLMIRLEDCEFGPPASLLAGLGDHLGRGGGSRNLHGSNNLALASLLMGQGANDVNAESLLEQGGLSGTAGASPSSARDVQMQSFSGFSGTPHTLAEQQQTAGASPEPFSGTPFRLV